MRNDNDIEQLSIKALLTGTDQYIIPMYQRNYSWEEGEITSLIQDIIDYMPKNDSSKSHNYYIGTLVVYKRKDENIEVIDGQQRLTTLSLIASYLKNIHDESINLSWYKALNIHFESRINSQKTFAKIFDGKDPLYILSEKEVNSAIVNGYKLIEKILPQKIGEKKVDLTDFANYLFDYVQVMRVKVPNDTNLNHYFEIMNSRGEQLEKHEILKSKMMEVLNKISDATEKEESLNCLHLVWEACANMESYSQMGFRPEQRHAIYGENDWGKFEANDFEDLREKIKNTNASSTESEQDATLENIINKPPTSKMDAEKLEDSPQRFNSVINFSNFLLHILRVYSEKDIPLDDKQLIKTFDEFIFNKDEITAIKDVKEFIFALLKCKYLFDQYIIKRDLSKGADGEWSLMRMKLYQGNKAGYVSAFGDEDNEDNTDNVNNRHILMLLSAFHVSTPTLVYKHWLNAALNYLYNAEKLNSKDYLSHIESIANAFIFDRFLAKNGKGADYYDIIYTNKGQCQCKQWEDLDESKLHYGNIENNFVFNYLDYLLWCDENRKSKQDPKISSFKFTFRSSVEHYYPQHPINDDAIMDDKPLNSFGNLCLISHSKNSRLSNFSPKSKAHEFNNAEEIDSIKQYLMTQIISNGQEWDEKVIKQHNDDMTNHFKKRDRSTSRENDRGFE